MLSRENRVRQEKDIKKLLRSRIRKNLGLVEIIASKIDKLGVDRPDKFKNNNIQNYQNKTEKNQFQKTGVTGLDFEKVEKHKLETQELKIDTKTGSFEPISNFDKKPENKNSLSFDQDSNSFRLVVIISKKIHKKATQRRIIKRRISFIFEELKAQNRLPKNIQMAILVKEKGILQTKFCDLAEIIKKGARDVYFFLNSSRNNNSTNKPKNLGRSGENQKPNNTWLKPELKNNSNHSSNHSSKQKSINNYNHNPNKNFNQKNQNS